MEIIESSVYSKGTQFPIFRPENSPWIVVDALGASWNMDWPEGKAIAFDIHLDRDDTYHEFLTPESWRPFPNAKKLCAAYNRPFERAFRLRIRRAVEWESISQIYTPHMEAFNALLLSAMIRDNPNDAHIAEPLEYYPDGHKVRGPQVWRNGTFWLRIGESCWPRARS